MRYSDAEIAECKLYMHLEVDEHEEDPIIDLIMASAAEYLEGAGIVDDGQDSARYKLAWYGLTLHYYDTRNDMNAEMPMPRNVRNLIKQLEHDCELKAAGGIL